MAHTHHWTLYTSLPIGIPDTEGWVPMLLIRACRGCASAEVYHGAQQLARQRSRLTAWEA